MCMRLTDTCHVTLQHNYACTVYPGDHNHSIMLTVMLHMKKQRNSHAHNRGCPHAPSVGACSSLRYPKAVLGPVGVGLNSGALVAESKRPKVGLLYLTFSFGDERPSLPSYPTSLSHCLSLIHSPLSHSSPSLSLLAFHLSRLIQGISRPAPRGRSSSSPSGSSPRAPAGGQGALPPPTRARGEWRAQRRACTHSSTTVHVTD